ncbi:MAG: ABC transporter permease [Burkholderiaceae bacterium]|nr:ABC transporter permease [Burkholderiaceae bacterium]
MLLTNESAAARAPAPSSASGLLATLAANQTLVLLVLLAVVVVVGGLLVPRFFQTQNIANVVRMTAIVGLVALGETLVLLTREIDLSLGSIMSLSLAVSGLVLDSGSGVALALTCATGLLLGLVNGIIVTAGRISSLIVTLGTLSIYGGLASVVAGGQAQYLYGLEGYLWLGKGSIVGIPAPAIVFVVVAAICSAVLACSKAGRAIYYTGASEIAAWYSGVSVNAIKIAVFGVAGLFAAMAGPMFASQTNRITPTLGAGFELAAIAIAVLGGTALDGARGSPLGTLIGALIFGVLLNILALSGVGTYGEQILKGALLILIVVIFQALRRGR